MAFGGAASAPPRALGIATCVTGVAEGFAGDRSSRGRGRARDEEEKERARVQGSSLPILSRAANLSRRCPIRRLPDYPGRTVFDLPSTPDGISSTVRPRAATRRRLPADIVGATMPFLLPSTSSSPILRRTCCWMSAVVCLLGFRARAPRHRRGADRRPHQACVCPATITPRRGTCAGSSGA